MDYLPGKGCVPQREGGLAVNTKKPEEREQAIGFFYALEHGSRLITADTAYFRKAGPEGANLGAIRHLGEFAG